MKTKDGLDVELIAPSENGYWDCVVTMPDGQTLDCCEVFAGGGNDFARETLRDMSLHPAREL